MTCGSDETDRKKCPGCNGHGYYKELNDVGIYFNARCKSCDGSGEYIYKKGETPTMTITVKQQITNDLQYIKHTVNKRIDNLVKILGG